MLAEGRGGPVRVGPVLRRAREYLGLSLREVERRTGRSNAYLSQVERGLIKQPDPVVLLELAELYRLDFMTIATWAGWVQTEEPSEPNTRKADSATYVLRRVLDLDKTQRARVLGYIEDMLRGRET